jgi:hypothetical protein
VPACGLVGGTKEDPLVLENCAEWGDYAVQEDNVMVEWNVPAANDWEEFFGSISLRSDQAKTFGCEPDFDAYLGGQQRRDGAMDILGNTRTCGGHIHLGGDFQCPDFVAALFPGVFRPKPYGIEYRTPSSVWTSDERTMEYVSIYAMKCSAFLTETPAEELQRMFRTFPWLKLREYMMTDDRELRRELIFAAANVGITA